MSSTTEAITVKLKAESLYYMVCVYVDVERRPYNIHTGIWLDCCISVFRNSSICSLYIFPQ